MKSKLNKLTNWVEENKVDISSVALKSIDELIECGETSTSKKTPHGISDWTGEVKKILNMFDIKFSFGNNHGKFIEIQDEIFLTECDYYLFEKEMPSMIAKVEEIVNQIDQTILQILESNNFTLKTYISRPEQIEFNWIDLIRHMPDGDRKLTDKEKITKIINKS